MLNLMMNSNLEHKRVMCAGSNTWMNVVFSLLEQLKEMSCTNSWDENTKALSVRRHCSVLSKRNGLSFI